ncbi:MAG: Uma2 family endonuclease [Gemmataceae bacterium]|nr:Uma2 family endonuclease [Gemmataceae bacterium]
MARFSVAAYQKMTETGILSEADRVELLEHYVVLKMPRNPLHDSTIQGMVRPLLHALPAGWDLRIQSAITLSDSQPEPDLAVVRGSAFDYRTQHPTSADVGLAIQVADSSLLRDQRDKSRIYARAGIPVNWADRTIEVYEQPQAGKTPVYDSVRTYRVEESVPLLLAGTATASLDAKSVLG